MKVKFEGSAAQVRAEMLVFLGIMIADAANEPVKSPLSIVQDAEQPATVAPKQERAKRGDKKVDPAPVINEDTPAANVDVNTQQDTTTADGEAAPEFESLEAFRKAIIDLKRDKEAFKGVLKSFGLATLPTAKPEDYSAIYAACVKLPIQQV